MSTTTAAQFAWLKLEYPRWQLSRSEGTELAPAAFVAVERSTGHRVEAATIGEFTHKLHSADWTGARQQTQ